MNHGKIYGYTILGALAVVLATSFFLPDKAKAEGVGVDADVPLVEEQVDEAPKWYSPGSWKAVQAVKEKFNAEQQLTDRIAELETQLRDARATMLGHDALLEAAGEQNDRTIAHFEGLLAERDDQVEALRSQNKTYDEAIQSLQDKDNSLMFVEGCWIPKTAGEALTH